MKGKYRMSQSTVTSLPISWPESKIKIFCDRWAVAELFLFGSILRDDFHADSDIDILIAFTPKADWSLFEHIKICLLYTSDAADD